jgi:hypothetical protein
MLVLKREEVLNTTSKRESEIKDDIIRTRLKEIFI